MSVDRKADRSTSWFLVTLSRRQLSPTTACYPVPRKNRFVRNRDTISGQRFSLSLLLNSTVFGGIVNNFEQRGSRFIRRRFNGNDAKFSLAARPDVAESRRDTRGFTTRLSVINFLPCATRVALSSPRRVRIRMTILNGPIVSRDDNWDSKVRCFVSNRHRGGKYIDQG